MRDTSVRDSICGTAAPWRPPREPLSVRGACVALTIATAIWMGCACCPAWAAQTRAQIAADTVVITSMYGAVSVRHGDAGWQAAKANTILRATDAVRTGKDARAELTVLGGGQVRMEENTHLLIRFQDQEGGLGLQAVIGNVWISIERAFVGPKGFRIEMPSAVAAVKGTVFACSVDEEGNCETTVYDGEVRCEADGGQFDIPMARCFVRGPAVAAHVIDRDLDRDAVRDWVIWNRRRDLLQALGNPRVFVAAAEHNGTGRQADPIALRRAMTKLQRAGFNVKLLRPEAVPDRPLSPGLDWLFDQARLPEDDRPREDDIVVAAEFLAQAGQAVDGGDTSSVYSSRATGRAVIYDPGARRALAEWDARRPGRSGSGTDAGHDALRSLGDRFGEEMPSYLMEAMMAKLRTTRIVARGIPNRKALYGFAGGLRRHPQIKRVFPRSYHRGVGVLAVATSLGPAEVARWLKQVGGARIADLSVQDMTVEVTLHPDSQGTPRPDSGRSRPRRSVGRAGGPNPPVGRSKTARPAVVRPGKRGRWQR